MTAASGALLAADLGGTRARFLARLPDGSESMHEFRAADFATADEVIAAAVERFGLAGTRVRAAFAAAGPVHDHQVRFTNLPWTLDARGLEARFGFERVVVLNDVEAAARAAARALPEDATTVHDAPTSPGARHALISVGTGLGVAYWRGAEVDASEAGHMRFPAPDGWRRRLHDRLAHDGDVEWEHVVSGPGLQAIDAMERGTGIAPADVTRRAAEGDATALTAVGRLSESLGVFAAELVLTAPAPGGVLLGGGVVAALGTVFDEDAFCRGFTSGRMHAQLRSVPVWRTADTRLALRGAMAAA